jgi:hypothetical protein
MNKMSIGGILNLALTEQEHIFNCHYMYKSFWLGSDFDVDDFKLLRLMYRVCKDLKRIPGLAKYVKSYMSSKDRFFIFFDERGDLRIGLWGDASIDLNTENVLQALSADVLRVISTHEISDVELRRRLKDIYSKLCNRTFSSSLDSRTGIFRPQEASGMIKSNIVNAKRVLSMLDRSDDTLHIYDYVDVECSNEAGVVKDRNLSTVSSMLRPVVESAIPFMRLNFLDDDLVDVLPSLVSAKQWIQEECGLRFLTPSIMRQIFYCISKRNDEFKPLLGEYSDSYLLKCKTACSNVNTVIEDVVADRKTFTLEDAKQKVLADLFI